ncbi:hypothetical protein N8920_02230 [Opitutales bacterium]|nr:hypothetical protein [Opitutales bacterium]
MFEDIIDRIGTNLGLTADEIASEEFINSKLVKSICVQLVYGGIVVFDSERGLAATTVNSIESLCRNKEELFSRS